ncbi:conserved hypothetical protein [Beggiatoa sp. PS]|nr:conserved hypothetical protein [Beggiatoa sp. PS]
MQETIEQTIDRFVKINERFIETAVSDENRKNGAVHSKVLLSAIFDSIAKSAYPDERQNEGQNSERFKKTIRNYSGWKDWERVSLLHLCRMFEIYECPDNFKVIRDWSREKYSKAFPENWRPQCKPLVSEPTDNHTKRYRENGINDKDLLLEDVKELWPKDNSGNLLNFQEFKLSKLQHDNLFSLYRNKLVHEFRSLGALDPEDYDEPLDIPHYSQVKDANMITSQQVVFTARIELAYPVNFFCKLCRTTLERVANKHKTNSSNPFAAYPEGTYWIPKFNESLN